MAEREAYDVTTEDLLDLMEKMSEIFSEEGCHPVLAYVASKEWAELLAAQLGIIEDGPKEADEIDKIIEAMQNVAQSSTTEQ